MRVNARVASSTVSRSSMTAAVGSRVVSGGRGVAAGQGQRVVGGAAVPQVEELGAGEAREAGVVAVVVLEVEDAEVAAAVAGELGEQAHHELGLAHAGGAPDFDVAVLQHVLARAGRVPGDWRPPGPSQPSTGAMKGLAARGPGLDVDLGVLFVLVFSSGAVAGRDASAAIGGRAGAARAVVGGALVLAGAGGRLG